MLPLINCKSKANAAIPMMTENSCFWKRKPKKSRNLRYPHL